MGDSRHPHHPKRQHYPPAIWAWWRAAKNWAEWTGNGSRRTWAGPFWGGAIGNYRPGQETPQGRNRNRSHENSPRSVSGALGRRSWTTPPSGCPSAHNQPTRNTREGPALATPKSRPSLPKAETVTAMKIAHVHTHPVSTTNQPVIPRRALTPPSPPPTPSSPRKRGPRPSSPQPTNPQYPRRAPTPQLPPTPRHPRESGDPGPRLHNQPTRNTREGPPPLRHTRPLRHPRESGDPDPRLHNQPTRNTREGLHPSVIPAHSVIPAKAGTQALVSTTHQPVIAAKLTHP